MSFLGEVGGLYPTAQRSSMFYSLKTFYIALANLVSRLGYFSSKSVLPSLKMLGTTAHTVSMVLTGNHPQLHPQAAKGSCLAGGHGQKLQPTNDSATSSLEFPPLFKDIREIKRVSPTHS